MFSADVQESGIPRLRKDAAKIGTKLLYVLTKACYRHRGEELVKWDLFGPFLISLLFPLGITDQEMLYRDRFIAGVRIEIVYYPNPQRNVDQQNLAFALFFSFLWSMAFLSALNACLVGTYMDYLPLMSIVLYEMLPICISAAATKIIPFIPKVIIVAPAVIYSLALSKRTLEGHFVKDKWILAYKPIVFMYVIVGVLVIFNA